MVRILSDPRHAEALEALKRYDVVMAPLLKRIAELRAELAELDRGPAAVALLPSQQRRVRNGQRDGTLQR